jgi:hypothetical protein
MTEATHEHAKPMRCGNPPASAYPTAAMTSPMATLFAFAGWKRKTEDTTVGEVAAAKNARKDQDEKALSGLRAAAAAKAAAAGPAGGAPGQQARRYSQNSDALRKRIERARQRARSGRRSGVDVTEIICESPGAASEARRAEPPEAETHYKDSRGRIRKRRMLRSRAGAAPSPPSQCPCAAVPCVLTRHRPRAELKGGAGGGYAPLPKGA